MPLSTLMKCFLRLGRPDVRLMLHNPAVIGGTWFQSEKKLVALSGFGTKATDLCLKEKSIMDVKQKVPLWKEVQEALAKNTPLQDLKGKKELFLYKNLIPVQHSFVKAFLEIEKFLIMWLKHLAQSTETQPLSSPNAAPDVSTNLPSKDSDGGADDDSTKALDDNIFTLAEENYITHIACNQKE